MPSGLPRLGRPFPGPGPAASAPPSSTPSPWPGWPCPSPGPGPSVTGMPPTTRPNTGKTEASSPDLPRQDIENDRRPGHSGRKHQGGQVSTVRLHDCPRLLVHPDPREIRGIAERREHALEGHRRLDVAPSFRSVVETESEPVRASLLHGYHAGNRRRRSRLQGHDRLEGLFRSRQVPVLLQLRPMQERPLQQEPRRSRR